MSISLHFKIKLRAWGITFGTIEDTKDVSSIFFGLVKKLIPTLPFGEFDIKPFRDPITLYNDKGVLIELK